MNGGDLVLVAVVLVLGCAAFFVGIIYLFCSAVACIGRGMFALMFPGRFRRKMDQVWPGNSRRCPNPKCGEVESRPARYCGHCGTKLGEDPEIVRGLE